MKQTPTWAVLGLLMGVVPISMVGGPSHAQPTSGFQNPIDDLEVVPGDDGRWHGFAKPEYLLQTGGTPPTLKQMAAHPEGPRHFFRHENAYLAFKGGFEKTLGRELSDAAFVQILGSDGVRDTTDCVGRIKTNRVNDAGEISYFNRACRPGEKLIEVKVDGSWHVVGSQGCLNQVFEVYRPVTPKPKPKPKTQQCVWVDEGKEYHPGGVISSPGLHVHGEGCGHDLSIYLPGTTMVLPGQVTTGARLVCR